MHRNGNLSNSLYVYYTEPLFNALVVFLNEWAHFKKMYIKNDILKRNMGIRRGYRNRAQPAKGHSVKNERA